MASESKSDGSVVAAAGSGGGGVAGLDVNIIGEPNPRGIPTMKFIEDVGEFLEAEGATVKDLLGSLQVMHSKYELMQRLFRSQRSDVSQKVPAIEVNLKVIRTLEAKKEAGDTITTHFNLTDSVHAKALVEPEDRVGLWLGAGVMMEYSYEEATSTLSTKLEEATKKLEELESDLDFLRDQLITTQVNMARVFNHDVKVQRAKKTGA